MIILAQKNFTYLIPNKMKTDNAKLNKLMRLASSLMAVTILLFSTVGNAHARILFEDDTYFNIQSEGIILDYNDNVITGVAATGTYTMADAVCITGETYTATINGTAVVYTAVTGDNCGTGAAADTVAILAGLSTAIDADGTVGPLVDAVATANTITLTATAAGTAGNYTTVAADTSASQTLVATGANMTGGVDGYTIDIQFGADGSDAVVSYDPFSQDITLSTPGGDFDFSDDNLTTTGGALFSGSSEFHIREVADESVSNCTNLDEIVLDTTENRIYICTAIGSPGTWVAADSGSSQDFDDVYDTSQSGANLTMEIDNGSLNFNITTADSFTIQDGGSNIAEFTGAGAINFDPTSGQNFDVTTLGAGDILFTASDIFDIDAAGAVGIDSDTTVTIGGASVGITADGGVLDLTGDGTNDINILNAGAAIDMDSATFDLDTTGIFSLDGVGASNVTTDSGALTLSTTTSGDVSIGAADDVTITAGDDIIFDDLQLASPVQMTVSETGIDAEYGTIGIIDAFNLLADFTAGDGADIVGVEDGSLTFIAAVRADLLNQTITYTADTGGTGGNAITVTLVETAAADLGGDSATAVVTVAGSAITVTFQDDSNAGNPETVGQLDIIECLNSAASIITSGGGVSAGDGIACTITNDATSLVTASGGTAATDAVAVGATSLTGGLASGLPASSSVQDALERLDIQWGDLYSEIGATLVGIEDVDGNFTATDVEGALAEIGTAVSINGVDLTFYPEYPDATVYADGTANKGTLEGLYDTAQDTNYYNWTTSKAALQDINIQFMFVLPPDFSTVGTNGLQFEYRTGTAVNTDNKVDVYMYERTGAGTTVACGSDLTNVNGTGAGGAFATGQITKAAIDGGCALTAGDVILIEVVLYDNSGAADFADVGYISLDYDN